jgi:hypothetical protein
MSKNFLKLNDDKTEVLLVGPKLKRDIILSNLGNLAHQVKPKVTSLGVILDAELSFKPHISKVTQTAYFHLRNIAKVRPFLTQQDAEKLIHAFITSRLDYCNALFTGLPKKHLKKLALIQNSAARLLTKTKKREHITPVLAELHWLPISYRIDFKVMLITYKALNGIAPSYISELLISYQPQRKLRSSNSNLLIVPKVLHKQSGEAAFIHYAPKLWNTLPLYIKQASSVNIFKKDLKTYLYRKAFS